MDQNTHTILREIKKLTGERLHLAMEQFGLFSWEYNIEESCFIRIAPMFSGYYLPQWITNFPETSLLDEGLLPESKQLILDCYQRIRDGENESSCEFGMYASDGSRRWCRMHLMSLSDTEGKPVRAIGLCGDITAQYNLRKQFEQEMEHTINSEQGLFAIIRANINKNQLLYFDSDNRFHFAEDNENTYDEVVEDIMAFIPDEEEKNAFYSLFQRKSLIDSFYQNKHELSMEFRVRLEEDRFSWIRITVKLLWNEEEQVIYCFGYAYDIDAVKMEQTVVRRMLHTFHAATNEMYVIVVMLDYKEREYNILQSRRARMGTYVKMRGSLEELQGMIDDIYDDEECREYAAGIMNPEKVKEMTENGTKPYTYIGKSTEKYRSIWYQNSCVAVTEDAEPERYSLYMVQNINEQMEREDKLRSALLELEFANKAKEAFFAQMSHEMRTPLTAINGMLEMMEMHKEAAEEERTSYLKRARLASSHLLGMMNNLLDMSCINEEKLSLKPHPFYISDMVAEVSSVIGPLAENKEIEYTLISRKMLQKSILGDSNRIQQILINVLTNAVKYTPKGGRVTLSCSTKREKKRERMELIVQDNGIGMTEEFQKVMFEPFRQMNHETGSGGVGLGLFITRKLVEMMNGNISVDSKPGEGTRVKINIPFDYEQEEISEIKQEQGETKYRFDGLRVLIAEDNEINLEIAKFYLESCGCIVTATTDGKQALDAFSASKVGEYKIIFLDIMMPVMDGNEAAEHIRALKRSDAATIPIAAITANAFAEDIRESKARGIDYYLTKPYEKERIYELLASLKL